MVGEATPIGDDASGRPLAPVGLADEIDDVLEARLAGLVVAARSGDAAARNEIFRLLGPKLNRWIDREWWLIRSRTDLIDPGDVRGEAFLVLADLIVQWPGEGGFGAYAMRVFPWRLRSAVRTLAGLPVRLREVASGRWDDPAAGPAGREAIDLGLAAEESWLAQQALALLEVMAEQMVEETDRLVLVWRVRDGRTMTDIARQLGMSRRQVYRVWDRITIWVRSGWAA